MPAYLAFCPRHVPGLWPHTANIGGLNLNFPGSIIKINKQILNPEPLTLNLESRFSLVEMNAQVLSTTAWLIPRSRSSYKDYQEPKIARPRRSGMAATSGKTLETPTPLRLRLIQHPSSPQSVSSSHPATLLSCPSSFYGAD